MAELEHTFGFLHQFPDETFYGEHDLVQYYDDNLLHLSHREYKEFQKGVENLARPRLTKEQVDILEAQFRAHQKPNSMVKRQLAMQTKLTLPRVANWFQNRRAKAKHQRKQEESGSHKSAHSDLALFENPHLGRERSNSGTDLSTIDSEGELYFVTNIAAPRTMSTVNQALFDGLWKKLALKVLGGFLNRPPSTNFTTAGSSSKGATSQGVRAAPGFASRTSQAHTLSAKRSADSQDNSDDADEQDDRGNFKRQRPAASPETRQLLLACPYFKMDPIRYSERNIQEQCYRGCASSLLRNIPRLKQHLYRVHRRPKYYCSRCYATFETQALVDIHNRQRLSCAVSEPQFQERMDNDQMNAIKRRNRRVDVPAEWYSIFKILFPNAVLPASPYADRGSNRAVQNFISYFRDEAPSVLADLIRETLESRLPLDEQTQEILDEAFEHAVSQLVLRFQSRLDDLDSSPPLEQPETISTASSNQLESGNAAGVALQGTLGLGTTTNPDDLFFDVASETWLDPNFFD